MPLVILKTKEEYFTPKVAVSDEKHPLKVFAEQLTSIVARNLSASGGGELTPKDVEVEVREFGKFDVRQADVEIIIFANEYPERAENLGERRIKIGQEIYFWLTQPSLENLECPKARKISVWIPLVRGGSYGELTLPN